MPAQNENDPYRSEAMAKSEEMTQMLKQHFMQTAAMQNQIGAQMSGFTPNTGGMNSGAAGAAAVTPPMKDSYTVGSYGGMPGDTAASVGNMNEMSPEPPMIKSPIIKSYSSNQYEETIPSDRYSIETPTVQTSSSSMNAAPVVSDIPETASLGGARGGGTASYYNGGESLQQNEYSDPSMKNSYETGANNWGGNFMNGAGQREAGYDSGLGGNAMRASSQMSSSMHMSPSVRHMTGMEGASSNMGGRSPNMGGGSSNMGGGSPNMEGGSPNMENESEEGEDGDDDDEDENAQQVGDDLDPIMQAQVSKWQDSIDPMVSKIYHETESEKNVKQTLANTNKYPLGIEKYLSGTGASQYIPGIQRKTTMFRHKHRRRHNQKTGAARQTLEKPPISIDYTDKTSEFITAGGNSQKRHRNPFVASSIRTNARKSLLREGFIGSLYKNLLKEDQKILRTAFTHRKASKTPKKEATVQEHGGKRGELSDTRENKDSNKDLTPKKESLSLEKLLNVITPKEENSNEDTSSRSVSENKPGTDSQPHLSVPLATIDEWAMVNKTTSSSTGTVKSSPDEVFSKSGTAAGSEPTKTTSDLSKQPESAATVGTNTTSENNHMKGFTIVGNKGDESVVVAITISKPGNLTNSTEHGGLSSLDNKAIGNVITSMINAAALNKEDKVVPTTSSRDDVHTVGNKNETASQTCLSNSSLTKNTKIYPSLSVSNVTKSPLSSVLSDTKSPSSSAILSPQSNHSPVSLLSNTSSITQLVTDIDSMIHPSLTNNTSTNMSLSLPSNISTKGSVPNNSSSPEDEENTASKCLQSKTCRKKVLTNFIDNTDTGKNTDGTARASVETNKTTEAVNNNTAQNDKISDKSEAVPEENSAKMRSGPVVIEIEEKKYKAVKSENNEKKSKTEDLTPSEVWKNAAVENINTKESSEIHESGNFDDHDYVKNSEESKVGDLPQAVKKSGDWKSKDTKVRQNFIVSRLINKNLQRIEDILTKYHGYEKKYKQRFGEDDDMKGVAKSKIQHPHLQPRVMNVL